MTDVTIILPCAGAGSRMGLDSPKELFEIRGKKLIDFSLTHIKAFIPSYQGSLRVAVVIRPSKQEVADYVARRLPDIPVKPVLFDHNYEEWPGSVYSANKLFSRHNLVLLPDSFLTLNKTTTPWPVTVFPDGEFQGRTLLSAALEVLARRPVMFAWVPCENPELLSSMGALRVEKDVVKAFQDKPRRGLEELEGLNGFNGFWTCYGFSRESGLPLYKFLIASLRHQSPILERQPFFPPAALRVGEYYDLGTPERLAEFIRSLPPSIHP